MLAAFCFKLPISVTMSLVHHCKKLCKHSAPSAACGSKVSFLLIQTKETLTLRATAFGSKPSIPESLLKKVEGLVKEQIMEFANLKQNKELAKTDGSKKNRIRGQQLCRSS